MTDKPFHITIGTLSKKGLDLESDLQILRAALLYADRVKLCSFTTSQVLSMFRQGKLSTKQFIDFLESHIDFYAADERERGELIEKARIGKELFSKRFADRNNLLARQKYESALSQMRKGWKDRHPVLKQENDLQGIEKAIKSNLLELHTFQRLQYKYLVDMEEQGRLVEGGYLLVEEFLEIVSKAIVGNSTYPLFDDTTGALVRSGIEDGKISASPVRVNQSKHSALASDYLRRLPVFDDTSIDEILDIRKELDKYLIRFRSGISNYATKISSAPWDKDFSVEADEIFIREVKPGIQDIEDKVKSSSYLITLIARKAVDVKSIGGGILSFFIERAELLPKYTSIGLGLGLPVAAAIYDAFKARQKEKQEIEKHNLYFYYRAMKRLSKR